MASKLKTISLSQIADVVGDYVDQVPSLDPEADVLPVIVATLPSGRLEIVDGFHRTAGIVKWCRKNDVALEGCEITVVLCDDGDLIAAAATPDFPRKQQAAIDAIYEAAGVDN